MSRVGFFVLLGLATCCIAENTRLKEVFSWNTVEFQFAKDEDRAKAITDKSFIPENNLPLGLDVWRDKLFVTVPRWKNGVVSSLNYIDISKCELPESTVEEEPTPILEVEFESVERPDPTNENEQEEEEGDEEEGEEEDAEEVEEVEEEDEEDDDGLLDGALQPVEDLTEPVTDLVGGLLGGDDGDGPLDAVGDLLGGGSSEGPLDAVTDVVGDLTDPVTDLTDGVVDALPEPVSDLVGGITDPVGDLLGGSSDIDEDEEDNEEADSNGQSDEGLLDTVTDTVGDLTDPVTDLTDGVVDALPEPVSDLVGGITDPVGDLLGGSNGSDEEDGDEEDNEEANSNEESDEGLLDTVTDTVGDLTDPVTDVTDGVVDALPEPVSDLVGGITDPVGDLLGGSNEGDDDDDDDDGVNEEDNAPENEGDEEVEDGENEETDNPVIDDINDPEEVDNEDDEAGDDDDEDDDEDDDDEDDDEEEEEEDDDDDEEDDDDDDDEARKARRRIISKRDIGVDVKEKWNNTAIENSEERVLLRGSHSISFGGAKYGGVSNIRRKRHAMECPENEICEDTDNELLQSQKTRKSKNLSRKKSHSKKSKKTDSQMEEIAEPTMTQKKSNSKPKQSKDNSVTLSKFDGNPKSEKKKSTKKSSSNKKSSKSKTKKQSSKCEKEADCKKGKKRKEKSKCENKEKCDKEVIETYDESKCTQGGRNPCGLPIPEPEFAEITLTEPTKRPEKESEKKNKKKKCKKNNKKKTKKPRQKKPKQKKPKKDCVKPPKISATSPALIPYPSIEANQLTDSCAPKHTCITSVFRVRVDACDRLWVMDTGVADILGNLKVHSKPQILIFNLLDDKLVKKFEFTDKDIEANSFFANIIVDVEKEKCDSAFAYVPDLGSYAMVVYDFNNNKSWRIKHNYFHFDPLQGNYHVGGVNFQWTDGVFGVALTQPNPDGSKTAYFHALSSTNLFSVNTNVLQNDAEGSESNYTAYSLIGSKGTNSQTSASFIHEPTGVMFYTQVNKDAIYCWNSKKEFKQENLAEVASDSKTMIFPNDLKVDYKGLLWVLTDKLPIFVTKGLDSKEINYRIFVSTVADAIKDTPCAP